MNGDSAEILVCRLRYDCRMITEELYTHYCSCIIYSAQNYFLIFINYREKDDDEVLSHPAAWMVM